MQVLFYIFFKKKQKPFQFSILLQKEHENHLFRALLKFIFYFYAIK